MTYQVTLTGYTLSGYNFYFTGYDIQDRSRPASARGPMVAEIQREVARYYQIPLDEMKSARRSREVARPRQVAMYLTKLLTPKSLPEIGRLFGDRDHTTVIHARKRIEALRILDADLDHDICVLLAKLDRRA